MSYMIKVKHSLQKETDFIVTNDQHQQSSRNFCLSSSHTRKDHFWKIVKCLSFVFHLESSNLSAPVDHFIWNNFSETISNIFLLYLWAWANTLGREIVLKCQSCMMSQISRIYPCWKVTKSPIFLWRESWFHCFLHFSKGGHFTTLPVTLSSLVE